MPGLEADMTGNAKPGTAVPVEAMHTPGPWRWQTTTVDNFDTTGKVCWVLNFSEQIVFIENKHIQKLENYIRTIDPKALIYKKSQEPGERGPGPGRIVIFGSPELFAGYDTKNTVKAVSKAMGKDVWSIDKDEIDERSLRWDVRDMKPYHEMGKPTDDEKSWNRFAWWLNLFSSNHSPSLKS